MKDAELYRLYKLHEVDSAIHDLQHRAAALDKGQRETEEYKRVESASAAERDAVKKALADLAELERQREVAQTKLTTFTKQLYDGSVTNSREIEALQKEVEMLEKQKDDRGLLIEKVKANLAPLKAATAEDDAKLEALRKAIGAKREKAKVEYARIQNEFQKKKAQRDEVAKDVPPEFARRYDAIRHKTGGTAMAAVTPQSTCSQCGMHVPEKTKEHVRSGLITPCEQCGRILFVVQPVA